MDKVANRPRGFAFLQYATEEESQKAIEGMHGKVCPRHLYFGELSVQEIFSLEVKRKPEFYGCLELELYFESFWYLWKEIKEISKINKLMMINSLRSPHPRRGDSEIIILMFVSFFVFQLTHTKKKSK